MGTRGSKIWYITRSGGADVLVLRVFREQSLPFLRRKALKCLKQSGDSDYSDVEGIGFAQSSFPPDWIGLRLAYHFRLIPTSG